jgi:hypothetical protein
MRRMCGPDGKLRAVISQRNSFVGFGLLEVTVAPEMQRSQD